MTERPADSTFATAFDGAALAFAALFEQMISIAHPIESRPFPYGAWQHFPNGRKWYPTTDEFYVLTGNAEKVIAAIGASDAGPHHVINLVGADPAQDDPIYQASGYTLDVVEILMDRILTVADVDLPDDPRIVSSLTDRQIAMLAEVWNNGRTANGYQPIRPAHNTAPGLVQRFIEIDGEPAAYGRALVVDGVAFLSDVNTFPKFRRRGLGRAIMDGLHSGLARAGATRVILTSTKMGLPLYEQLGYRTLAEDWIYASVP